MSLYRKTLLLLTVGIFYQSALSAQDSPDVVNTDRFTLRHIESKGVGYNQGYTTFEAFFIPLNSLQGRWIPFLDGRAHVFNNSRPAANVGVGLRYLNSRLWGANLYYDFRQTSKLNYNQVSCGLETIGEKIDARINGYFPVGKHTSTRGSTTIDYFSGHHLYVIKKQEFAMQGVNAELGIHLGRSKKMDFYTAFGPYFFCNNSKQAIGGSFRISLDLKNVFAVEVNTSYDSLFKWIGQGQVSLSYAFKPKKFDRLRYTKKSPSSFDIRSRILQKVDKFEIIVTDVKKQKSLAINPATGQPYFFLFLNPNKPDNGVGSFEAPFNSLESVEAISLTDAQQAPTLKPSLPPEAPSPVLTKTIATEVRDTPILTELIKPKQDIAIVSSPITYPTEITPYSEPSLSPVDTSSTKKSQEILHIPGKGQELNTTLGTVMVPASQKGHPKITHVKDIDYQGKKTHVFVITMEEDEVK